MNSVKAIIFDWDNTIVNSFDCLVVFHLEVGQKLGWPPVTIEQIRAAWSKPFEELIQALWPTYDSKQFDMAYREYILNQTIPEISGAVTAITQLKHTFLLSIVTGAPRYEVEHFLRHIGLNEIDFFMIQASGEAKYHKPDPRVFAQLITRLHKRNINEDEILYVGDSTSDFYAARDANLQFIGVLTGSTTRQQFRSAGVDDMMILTSIAKLPKKLVRQHILTPSNEFIP